MKYFIVAALIGLTTLAETTIEPEILLSKPVALDGQWDSGWSKIKQTYQVTRLDFDSIINIRSMINDDTIYFLFEWDDQTLNNQHKPWLWDDTKKTYVVGSKREDRFIVRWGINVDSQKIHSTNDVWYWGSVRANQGQADDRYEILSRNPLERGLQREDFEGQSYYLKSQGDAGKRCWSTEYQKSAFWLDRSRYKPELLHKDLTPNEAHIHKDSRRDVQAYAVWKKGRWSMEVARKLRTGNFDDIDFNWGQEYFFDISTELYKNAHIVHNMSLTRDDTKIPEKLPLKLKMPAQPWPTLPEPKENRPDEED